MRKRLFGTMVVLLLVSLYLLLNSTFSPALFIQGLLQQMVAAPKAVLYSTKAQLFTPHADTVAQLKNENKQLIEKMADYQKVKQDNNAFRDQFAQTQDQADKILPARVIGFTGKASLPASLVINKGTSQGVKLGMEVVEAKNLVGRIGKISAQYSVVVLPVNTNFETVGKTAENAADGIVQGEDDFILFNNIPITDTLKKGDAVLTKGDVNDQGIGLKPDIVIGKVASVSRIESKPFQTALIQSLIDYSKLTEVFVVLE